MDAPMDPPMPEPLDIPAGGAMQQAADSNAGPDQLCDALGRLEASIEQRPSPAYGDPLSTLLDQVEASALRGGSTGESTEARRFQSALDRPEPEAEQQGLLQPDTRLKVPAEGAPASGQDGLAERSGQQMRKHVDPLRPWDVGSRDRLFSRQYPEPGYHMMGSGTGIRGEGPESRGFCNLREEWVWADDCASCSDFEREEERSGDQEDRCRHIHSDDEEDQGAGLEAPSDEEG